MFVLVVPYDAGEGVMCWCLWFDPLRDEGIDAVVNCEAGRRERLSFEAKVRGF